MLGVRGYTSFVDDVFKLSVFVGGLRLDLIVGLLQSVRIHSVDFAGAALAQPGDHFLHADVLASFFIYYYSLRSTINPNQ